MRVNGVPVVYRRVTEDELDGTEVDSDEVSGYGGTTTIEGNVLCREANLP